MPRQPVEHFYTEKELHEMVDRINAFASECSPWKLTHARREHQDLFGEVIKQGDHYFMCLSVLLSVIPQLVAKLPLRGRSDAIHCSVCVNPIGTLF